MIHRNRERVKSPSFMPKFSDPDLLRAVLNSDIWRHVFLGEKKALWVFVKAVFFLKLEMFISPLKTVLRYHHGKRTTGITITLMSGLMMVAFNTQITLGYLATFFPFAAPVMPFFMTGTQMENAAFIQIRSVNLMFFWIAYLALSTVHLLMIYYASGDETPTTKRGTSWLYVMIFRRLGVPEYAVQRFIEPVLACLIGYGLWATDTDFTFGLFLMIGAACLFFQECYDAVLKFSTDQ